MARWQPDARGRLLRAAIDLFAEQGYEATTTAEIAARAGLTKTTFFRHFPDKREVLFFGQTTLIERATAAIAAAPADAAPIEAVAAAVATLGAAHTDDQRDYAPRIAAVIATSDELRERAAFKRSSIAEAMTAALEVRGAEPLAAALAAEIGTRAYYLGFERWTEPGAAAGADELALVALDELRAAAAALA